MSMQITHWLLALVPVLVMLTIFVWFDAFRLMTLKEILVLLGLGGIAAIASYPVSGRLLDTLPIGFSNYSRFVAPWLEEASKAAAMIGLFWFNRIGYKLDAVISGFAIGAGFSVVENMLMSMIAAPRCSLSFAASAITCGSQPASCIDTGSSTGSHAAFCSDWRVSRSANS